MAAFTIFDHGGPHLLNNPSTQIAFFAFLGLAFAPRVWNAAIFGAYKSANQRAAAKAATLEERADEEAHRVRSVNVDQALTAYKSAEAVGAFIVTVLVALIVITAYWVGSFPKDPSLGVSLGVGIFVLVISLFVVVLCIDWLSETKAARWAGQKLSSLAKPGHYLAAFYDWIDSGLVYIGAHVAGADHFRATSRYSVLSVTLLALVLMGWFLPPPYGVAPVLLGFVLAFSISRLWSWVEEDRNLASITQFSPKAPRRVGFREDFRDETLLGFIFVLLLIPVGIMQVHQSELFGGPLFNNVDPSKPIPADNYVVWLGYFGFELAKALPIVDWADIYHLGPGSDSITPIRPLGMHAVFAARALVDLLLIAALLQAIGIASRNRQQKFLYARGQINRLDELVEKREIAKAIRHTAVTPASGGKTTFELGRLADSEFVNFRVYNEGRLRELFIKSDPADIIRDFIAQIFAERGVKPAPAMVIVQDIAS
ncbi:MAG: hypothetical protein KDA61_16495, partial [Planctomycetales bacterium]|nr:hypothetical protein [Planctomycetales bacterium]